MNEAINELRKLDPEIIKKIVDSSPSIGNINKESINSMIDYVMSNPELSDRALKEMKKQQKKKKEMPTEEEVIKIMKNKHHPLATKNRLQKKLQKRKEENILLGENKS